MSLQGHKKRVLVALIALPLLILIIVKLPPYFFLGLLTLVCAVSMWEFLRMYKTNNFWIFSGILCSVILFLLNCFYHQFALYYYALTFMALTTIRLFIKKNPQYALNEISPIVVGLLYIPALLAFHWFLRIQGWQWVIYLYAIVWVADSFAYYIGKGFGKRKLYPEVSPKKTWAGAYGSLIGGVVASFFVGYLLLSKSPVTLLLNGFLIGFISIFGDLVESMFKRDAQVKDSSFLFPEHGGVLDKIDSMLFAGVLLYFLMNFL
ncbi:phosphatidate cytidylyltransferase [Thermodesulfovibrio aggregans]|uniref:Phosphatidate cytidylyltransferase n=1 Tax=Thermodesulfovibrio aggregans TaxID=86166 RepID=A0A0U9HSE5_9BACT|nr:phosphatidate cytidylyltransferase [Thermodesulfovibrio aggregans]GAQ95337.1 phosphatidate cytidylyltransferase [Thermodesulfovibrio aggregans]